MIGALIAGAAAGILSGAGVGGGTLLLIYLTQLVRLPQPAAQGINLLYFLPAAALALPSHCKNGLVQRRLLLPSILPGLAFAAIGSFVAGAIETVLLRRIFGGFLICVGVYELLRKAQ